MPARPRPYRRLLAAALLLPLLAACGTKGSADAAPPSLTPAGAGGGNAGGSGGTIVLKHSDPGNAGPLAVAKKEGILERELAKVNAKVEWVQTPGAFSATVDLFKSGQVNVTNAAVAPAVGLFGKNLGLKIFAVSDVSKHDTSGLVAGPKSGITDVKGLAGKRVAVNSAAKGEYILLEALKEHGVPVDQVERVPLQPAEAASAFNTGKVDAWATFGNFYLEAKKAGGKVLASETQLSSDDLGIQAANEKLLAEHPEVFRVWVDVIKKLSEEQRQNPERFENVFDKAGPRALSGERLEDALKVGKEASIWRTPTAQDRTRIENVSAIFFENKVIDKPVTADQAVFDLAAAPAPTK